MSTRYGLALALALAGVLSTPARAALFEDDEARRAIIELRQRIDTLQQSNQRAGDDLRRSGEDTSQMRRSLLDLQSQIESLHVELAKLRGQNEQLGRDVSELQRLQKETAQGVNERLKKFEPGKVTLDGQEFVADPAERQDFEAALATFRSGKFVDVATCRPRASGWAMPNTPRATTKRPLATSRPCWPAHPITPVRQKLRCRLPTVKWNSRQRPARAKRWRT